jgi:GNAT superfamily N-acetyltransferase
MNKSEIQTKDGITYSHVPAIGRTILVPLFYKHIAELMKAGHCTFHTFDTVTDSDQGIIAEIDNKIVGYEVFSHDKEKKLMFEYFVYIYPEYRRRGIFAHIQGCVLAHAKANDIYYTQSLISIKNEVSIKAHINLGFDLFITKEMPGYYQYIHPTY